jgi:hypothetical protein
MVNDVKVNNLLAFASFFNVSEAHIKYKKIQGFST